VLDPDQRLYDAMISLSVDDRAETRRSDRGWRDRFVSECAAA